MWPPGEDVGEVQKAPESVGWVRCFFTPEGVLYDEEIVRRVAIVISAPSAEPYEFRAKDGERVSEFVEVKTRSDAEFFRDPDGPFHYVGKR